MDKNVEIQKARRAVQTAQDNYDEGCDGVFEDALWYELRAAHARLNALITLARKEETADGDMPNLW